MSAHANTNAQSSEAAHPALYTDHTIEVASLKLHYVDFGTAGRQPMLCVHGGAASTHWFDFVAGDFNKDHHVFAIDQRGHGDSAWAPTPEYTYERYAADLDEFAAKLNLKDFVLIGHSMGGAVALTYAAKHPGRVSRLVIVDTTMYLSPERIAKLREVGNRPGRTSATLEEFISRFRLRPGDSTAAPAVLRYLAEQVAQQKADGSWGHKFDREVYAVRESIDGLPHWDHVRIPALVVKGQRSERITPEIIAAVKARCPQAEFAEVANADHHVMLDNPVGFTYVVNAFLAKHKA
ncbi:MAG: alpha/beta hydrolase [Burkholderiales bacterium]